MNLKSILILSFFSFFLLLALEGAYFKSVFDDNYRFPMDSRFQMDSSYTPDFAVIKNIEIIKIPQEPIPFQRRNKPNALEIPNCKPLTFGIPETQDKYYFIQKQFTCVSPLKSIENITLVNDLFVLNCESPTQKIYLGNEKDKEIFGSKPYINQWNPYSSPVKSNNAEFAFGKCNDHNVAVLKNRFNNNVAQRAQNLTKKLDKTMKSIPLTVMILLIDSVSRQSFYRNLKLTTEFLKELQSSNSSQTQVYDFLFSTATKTKTISNITPILFGKTFEDHVNLINGDYKNENDWEKFEKVQNKTAIWKEFEKNGFVTMFSVETYKDFLAPSIGKKVLTDHVVAHFWNIAKSNFRFYENESSSQCIDGKPPHNFTFQYVEEFVKNYQDLNRFVYAHINTAHEETLARVKTLDKPLKSFLENFVKQQDSAGNEYVVLLMGDHGRYYKPITIDALTEKVLPGHFLLASKSLISRLDAHETLKINANRLTTRFDWHNTLKFMAKFPYLNSKPSEKEMQKFVSEKIHNKNSKNLFFQEAEKERNCGSLDIPEMTCICHNEHIQYLEKNETFQMVANEAISVINSFIQNNNYSSTCKSITKYHIGSIQYLHKELEDWEVKDFKIYVNTLESLNNPIVISLFFSRPYGVKQSKNKNKFLSSKTKIISSVNTNLNLDIKVYDISLKNPQEFPNFNKNLELKEICIGHRKEFIVLAEPNESCSKTCMSYNLACEDFVIGSNLETDIRNAYSENGKFYVTGISDTFLVKNISEESTKTIVFEEIQNCKKSLFDFDHFCVCSSSQV